MGDRATQHQTEREREKICCNLSFHFELPVFHCPIRARPCYLDSCPFLGRFSVWLKSPPLLLLPVMEKLYFSNLMQCQRVQAGLTLMYFHPTYNYASLLRSSLRHSSLRFWPIKHCFSVLIYRLKLILHLPIKITPLVSKCNRAQLDASRQTGREDGNFGESHRKFKNFFKEYNFTRRSLEE